MEKINELNSILQSFGIGAKCQDYREYKNASIFDLSLKPGTRIGSIEKYLSEISLALKTSRPTLKILPESGIVQLEIVKSQDRTISLFDIANKHIRPKGKLSCLLGEKLNGSPLWMDIVSSPHTLIGGASGSGKTTLLHNLIANLLLFPNVNLFLFDPKNIEFHEYDNFLPSKLKVSFDYQECRSTLEELSSQMDRRYLLMKEFNITADYFPFIVLIIDEFADLVSQDSDHTFIKLLTRLGQKSRSAGIHLILSTQRPSIDIVSGSIKTNFPARISGRVSTGTDSR